MNWKYFDATKRSVVRTRDDGVYESRLATDLLADSNVPDEPDLPDPKISIAAEIDRLERESLLNRGTREMQLFQLEERAAQVAAAKGMPVEMVLAANVYYCKLKALDVQISALREKLA